MREPAARLLDWHWPSVRGVHRGALRSTAQTVAEMTGALRDRRTYRIDERAFADGLRSSGPASMPPPGWRSNARSAHEDPRPQFYIASATTGGWGRVYNDRELFARGLEAVDRAIALARGDASSWTTPTCRCEARTKLKAELQAGLRRDASDLNPLKLFRPAQMSHREVFVLPLVFLTVALLGGRPRHRSRRAAAATAVHLRACVSARGRAHQIRSAGAGTVDERHAPADGERQRRGRPNHRVCRGDPGIQRRDPGIGAAASAVSASFCWPFYSNTLAASPDRVRVLRSVLVIFGSAFTLKFIVLAALSDPTGGRVKRMLQIMLEGLTLGTLSQDVYRPVTGYVAFVTLTLFVGGLALLRHGRGACRIRRTGMRSATRSIRGY